MLSTTEDGSPPSHKWLCASSDTASQSHQSLHETGEGSPLQIHNFEGVYLFSRNRHVCQDCLPRYVLWKALPRTRRPLRLGSLPLQGLKIHTAKISLIFSASLKS